MRATKTSVISILAVGLLAGSAVGVAAQEEEAAGEEVAGASYFTGQLIAEGDVVAEPDENIIDGILEGRGWTVENEAIETSDARLTGSLSRVLNANVHKLGDFEDAVFEANAWYVENNDGSWSGQGTALVHGGGGIPRDEATNLDTVVLTGEGAYEGLTAYVLADWTEDPVAVEGVVFPGEAPPFPEVPSAPEPEAAE